MATQENCCICFDELSETNKVTLECGHRFHFSCILRTDRTENRKCPLCRTRYAKIPPPFSELFARAIILRTNVSEYSGHKKVKAIYDLIGILVVISEVYGDNSLISALEVKIPELRKDISELGYSTTYFDNFEKRIKKLK
jgi:hypothetical protein